MTLLSNYCTVCVSRGLMILFKTDYNSHIVGGGKSPSLSNPGEYVTFFL